MLFNGGHIKVETSNADKVFIIKMSFVF